MRSDNFLLEEINENFTALDAGITAGLGTKVGVIGGMYTGNGGMEPNPIILGVQPRAVLVCYPGGPSYTSILAFAGVENPNCQLELQAQGFCIKTGTGCNQRNDKYLFVAWV